MASTVRPSVAASIGETASTILLNFSLERFDIVVLMILTFIQLLGLLPFLFRLIIVSKMCNITYNLDVELLICNTHYV